MNPWGDDGTPQGGVTPRTGAGTVDDQPDRRSHMSDRGAACTTAAAAEARARVFLATAATYEPGDPEVFDALQHALALIGGLADLLAVRQAPAGSRDA